MKMFVGIIAAAVSFALTLESPRAQQDDPMVLEAGAATFRVPLRYLLADYRDGGVIEPIWVRWFGFSFRLSDRLPSPRNAALGSGEIAVRVTGAQVLPDDPDIKQYLPAHRARSMAANPLLVDYTKGEEFGLERHEYCGLDVPLTACPKTYLSKAGSSPQVFMRTPYERIQSQNPTWTIQVFYPEDRILFWMGLAQSNLPRWKDAADAAASLMRSWRIP